MLSQGIPMLLGGDEIGRTQHGNNNAYCQDNEVSWFDWALRDENLALLGFTRRLMDFRQRHPTFRRRRWFIGRDIHGSGVHDIGWFSPGGEEMTQEEWTAGFAKSIAVFLNGEEIPHRGPKGERIVDDSFLLLFNAHHDTIEFTLPPAAWGTRWSAELDTAEPLGTPAPATHTAGDRLPVTGRSLVILQRVDESA